MTARAPVLAALAEVYRRPVAELDDATELDAIGDSLARFELFAELEERLGVIVPKDDEYRWRTVGDVVAAAELLVRAKGAAARQNRGCR